MSLFIIDLSLSIINLSLFIINLSLSIINLCVCMRCVWAVGVCSQGKIQGGITGIYTT